MRVHAVEAARRVGRSRRARLSERGPASWSLADAYGGALVGILAASALVIAPPAVASDRPNWWSYDRPAEYEPVKSSVKVPVRDGTPISCELWRPGRNGEPAPGHFPGIVYEFTPYARNSDNDGRSENGGAGPPFLAARGYAVLWCDVRGSGNSGGEFPSWFRAIEAWDNYDLIEWLASRAWSTGRVGQTGGSYGGITSYRVATLRPPHLVAIAPNVATSSIYGEFIYPGGIYSPWNANLWASVNGAAHGWNPLPVIQSFRDHPLWDDFWRQIDHHDNYEEIEVPVLATGGWQDLFQAGTVANYTGVLRNGRRGRSRSSGPWLIMGPWQHEWPDTAAFASVPAGTFLAWWDHWLMQLPTAPVPSATVTSFEQPRAGGRGWQQFPAWPPPDVAAKRMYLRRDRELAENPGSEGTNSYVVNPVDGPARSWLADNIAKYHPEDPAADQRVPDQARLTFTTRTLDDAVVVAGTVDVHLKAALSARDGYFVVKLEDVAPDGKVVEASTGYLKASHREGHAYEVPVVPGEVTEYVVAVKPTHWRFRKGHRIRLSLTSADHPTIPGDAPQGTVTIASGRHGSWAGVPVRGHAVGSANAGQPKARHCKHRGRVTIALRRLGSARIRTASAYVNGKRISRKRLRIVLGRRPRAWVRLRGLLARRHLVVRVVITTTHGRRIARSRAYTGCLERRP